MVSSLSSTAKFASARLPEALQAVADPGFRFGGTRLDWEIRRIALEAFPSKSRERHLILTIAFRKTASVAVSGRSRDTH